MKSTEQSQNTTQQPNALGLAVGILCCGICFLAFPKVVEMVIWLAWIFYGVGFVILLLGILGTCNELFSTR